MKFILLSLLFVSSVFAADPVKQEVASYMEPGPTTAMPDHVYDVFKTAILAYKFPDRSDLQSKNLAALDRLRTVPWPDFSKIKWVRLHNVDTLKEFKGFGMAWLVSESPTELVLMLPDLTVRHVKRSKFSSIDPMAFDDYLDKLVDRIKAGKEDKYWPGEFALCGGVSTGGYITYSAYIPLQYAFAAAAAGQDTQAAFIADNIMQMSPPPFEYVYDDLAGSSFGRGIQLIEDQRPWSEVLTQWEETRRLFAEPYFKDSLDDMLAQIRLQIPQEAQLEKTKVADPSNLPQDQQIQYYLARITDVRGEQESYPGNCSALGLGEQTQISDALVKIGPAAIPGLIEHLDDRRVTRSVGGGGMSGSYYVLRSQDVCLQCIYAIEDKPHYGSSAGFSDQDPERRKVYIEEIKAWWKVHGHESPVQWEIGTLDEENDINDKIRRLQKIEQMDPKAIDSIATLKRWAVGSNIQELAYIVDALGERGDVSLLPKIREIVQKGGDDAFYAWVLMRWGTLEDCRVLRNAARRDLAGGADLSKGGVAAGVLGSGITNKPVYALILVEYLDLRAMTSKRDINQDIRNMPWSTADNCMWGLIQLTGHDAEYKESDPPEIRMAAIDRWLAWWHSEGQTLYLKKYPELAAVLVDDAPGAQTTTAPKP